jgi:hypothetical protein
MDSRPKHAQTFPMGDTDLLPCPFCGSDNLNTARDGDAIRLVWCLTCQATGPDQYSKADWNTRAASLPPQVHGEPRTPKVRTSHHRNAEEAARLQLLVDQRYASPHPGEANSSDGKRERREDWARHVAELEPSETNPQPSAVCRDSGWQPIDTAPKDGKDYPIQICGGGFRGTCVAWWTGEIQDATYWAPMLPPFRSGVG